MTFRLRLLFLLPFPRSPLLFLTSSYSGSLADLQTQTPPPPHTERGSEVRHCEVDSHGYPRDTDILERLEE